MYIHRSVLLLFILICLFSTVGMDWIIATHTAWYRPFLFGLGVVLLAAWLQRYQGHDDY